MQIIFCPSLIVLGFKSILVDRDVLQAMRLKMGFQRFVPAACVGSDINGTGDK